MVEEIFPTKTVRDDQLVARGELERGPRLAETGAARSPERAGVRHGRGRRPRVAVRPNTKLVVVTDDARLKVNDVPDDDRDVVSRLSLAYRPVISDGDAAAKVAAARAVLHEHASVAEGGVDAQEGRDAAAVGRVLLRDADGLVGQRAARLPPHGVAGGALSVVLGALDGGAARVVDVGDDELRARDEGPARQGAIGLGVEVVAVQNCHVRPSLGIEGFAWRCSGGRSRPARRPTAGACTAGRCSSSRRRPA